MLKQILDAHAARSEKVWQTDRGQTVGASEIGQCMRRTFFFKNEDDPAAGIKRDPDYVDRWGARTRGSIYEATYWEPALRAYYGEKLVFAGNEQKTLVKGFLSATPDALIIDQPTDALAEYGIADIEGDCFARECKTCDPRTNLDEAKSENVYQAQVQMGLIRELTNYKPAYSIVSYTDASWWDEVKEFVVKFDPKIFDVAQRRATKIMTATDVNQLPPEGHIAGGRECEYCPFTGACGRSRADRVPDQENVIEPDAMHRIASLARQAKAIEAEAEAKAAEALTLKEEIKGLLEQAKTRKCSGDGVKISWAAVRGKANWDNKGIRAAAIAAGVDVVPFETEGSPYDRLTITIAGDTKTPSERHTK